ncbi:hypothetical protein HYZ98_05325 [Candidatus Peregrinibacteria bacterium]|nr:hypothetical protein [Candidatus Peregrinibacteria bacterium]
MNNTPQHAGRAVPSLKEAGERLAFPLFLFSIILFCFLLLSWVFLLPYISQVRMGGEKTSVHQLQSYHRALTERLVRAEDDRERMVLPTLDPLYRELRSKKLAMPSFLHVHEEVRQTALQVVPDIANAVDIERLRFVADTGVLEIYGRTGHVGPRSMTVLAQLTDALLKSHVIASLDQPAFTRQEDTNGFFSPFLIRAQLTSPSVP